MIAALALILCLAYDLVAFGLGSLLHRRQTGSWGWVAGLGASPAERLANALNPFYVTTLAASAGGAALVPTAAAAVALALCGVALEIQTRLVEEPFLISRHGAAFREHASIVGRFLPLIGRLPRS